MNQGLCKIDLHIVNVYRLNLLLIL